METKYIKEPVTWISDDEVDPDFVPLEAEPFVVRDGTEISLHVGDGETTGGILVARQSPTAGGSVTTPTDGINRPEIATPIDGAVDIMAQPLITASQYVGTGTAEDAHAGTHWQIATDSLFENLVVDTGLDIVALTTLDLAAKNITLNSGPHYVRVRYESTTGMLSEWSPTVQFLVNNDVQALPSDVLYQVSRSATDGIYHASSADGNRLAIADISKNQILVKDYLDGVWSEGIVVTSANTRNYRSLGNRIDMSADGSVIVATSIVRSTYDGGPVDLTQVHVFNWDGAAWVETYVDWQLGANNSDSVGDVAISENGLFFAVSIGEPSARILTYRQPGTGWERYGEITHNAVVDRDVLHEFSLQFTLSGDGAKLLVLGTHSNMTEGIFKVYEFDHGPSGWANTSTKEFVENGYSYWHQSYPSQLVISRDGSRYIVLSGTATGQVIYKVIHDPVSGWVESGSIGLNTGLGLADNLTLDISDDGLDIIISSLSGLDAVGYWLPWTANSYDAGLALEHQPLGSNQETTHTTIAGLGGRAFVTIVNDDEAFVRAYE